MKRLLKTGTRGAQWFPFPSPASIGRLRRRFRSVFMIFPRTTKNYLYIEAVRGSSLESTLAMMMMGIWAMGEKSTRNVFRWNVHLINHNSAVCFSFKMSFSLDLAWETKKLRQIPALVPTKCPQGNEEKLFLFENKHFVFLVHIIQIASYWFSLAEKYK